MANKKTLIVGASTNADRYAYKAANALTKHGHSIVNIGTKSGTVAGVEIQKGKPPISDLDTITLYIGAAHQPDMYDYLLGLKPKRIIFNPGTENPQFEKMAREKGIEVLEACTLVMLASNQY